MYSEGKMKTNIEVLKSCYNTMLGREPDEGAKAHWALRHGEGFDLQQLLSTILGSSEFASKWKDVLPQQAGAESIGFFNEQSQFGEVGRLVRQMVNTTAVSKIVVDVGANGRERSNSYDFLRYFGWKGVLIEANPNRNSIIEKEFAGTDYVLVNCAISNYIGEAIFHLGVNDDVSSLEAKSAEGWGPVQGEIKVAVRPLSEILIEHEVPREFDLLSIDAEGEDVRILNDTIAKGYRPCWVIMEAAHDPLLPTLDMLGLTKEVRTLYEVVDSTVANLILRLSKKDRSNAI